MGVGVDYPRHDGSAVKIDHSRCSICQRAGFGVGSDEKDATAANGERGSDGPGVVDGVDPSVDEDEISASLRSEHRWCDRAQRKVG